MSEPRSRMPQAIVGLVVGATIGLKMVVLLAFVCGALPTSFDQTGRYAFGFGWVAVFGLAGAVLAGKSVRKKPVSLNAGVADRDFDW